MVGVGFGRTMPGLAGTRDQGHPRVEIVVDRRSGFWGSPGVVVDRPSGAGTTGDPAIPRPGAPARPASSPPMATILARSSGIFSDEGTRRSAVPIPRSGIVFARLRRRPKGRILRPWIESLEDRTMLNSGGLPVAIVIGRTPAMPSTAGTSTPSPSYFVGEIQNNRVAITITV